MKNNKGFTLIELLVVIALIGIIAGLLFVYINPQKRTDDANDSKVKSNLAGVVSQASVSFSNNGNVYTEVCNENEVRKLAGLEAGEKYPGVCNAGEHFWVVSRKLPSGKYWCVDWKSNKKELDSQITSTQTEC
ncbi:hypothetical protein CSB11_01235 [Candidatus Campbellbacteria bacterium]|nr:MAG: hypothetical protein CSB11_01235 [Candidatus Campbellbacteria bacterium]